MTRKDRNTHAVIMLIIVFLFLAALCGVGRAEAQTAPTVPVRTVITWTNATTTDEATPKPLTGALALTRTHIYRSSAPIADAAILTPIGDVPPTQLTYTDDTTAAPGGKLHYRLKHTNIGGFSRFSNEAVKDIVVPVPNAPGATQITITIIIQ